MILQAAPSIRAKRRCARIGPYVRTPTALLAEVDVVDMGSPPMAPTPTFFPNCCAPGARTRPPIPLRPIGFHARISIPSIRQRMRPLAQSHSIARSTRGSRSSLAHMATPNSWISSCASPGASRRRSTLRNWSCLKAGSRVRPYALRYDRSERSPVPRQASTGGGYFTTASPMSPWRMTNRRNTAETGSSFTTLCSKGAQPLKARRPVVVF